VGQILGRNMDVLGGLIEGLMLGGDGFMIVVLGLLLCVMGG